MKQQTLAVAADRGEGFEQYRKPTKRDTFLATMEQIVPWRELCSVIEPHYPKAGNGRPPIGLERMLRMYFVQHWFNLADQACEEALLDSTALRRFVGIDLGRERVPDGTTLLKFRRLLETHKLGTGTIVDATIIGAPSSTKNADKQRDPEMHQTRKGQQWYFGMKCHIGVDIESGLVHTVKGTSGAVNDVIEANSLVRPSDREVFADAGYQGAGKRPDARNDVIWHIAMRPGKRRTLDMAKPMDALTEQLERVKAGIRARVEHPFRVLKRQFGHAKVRYRGLAKNTAQLHTLFALANLWMARRKLQGALA